MADKNQPALADDEIEEQDDAVIGSAFRWSLLIMGIVACAIGAGYWWWQRPEPEPAVEQADLEPVRRALPPVELPRLPFTDITKEAGITFVHENGATGDKLLPETMGGGCAFFDYDNDGDQDLLFVNSTRWPGEEDRGADPPTMELYQNDGKGDFKNVTKGSGLDVSFYGMGVACGDYDNDGLVDVFLSAVGPNRLFKNLGGGRFRDVTDSANVAGDANEWSTSSGWFDLDNDGDLDLLVANYVKWSRELDQSKPFTLKGGGRAYGRPQDFQGTLPYLYRNEGDGKFTEIAESAGLHMRNADTKLAMAKSLGVAFCDFDQDGYMDIFLANDTVRNLLFRNLANGKFAEIGIPTGIAYDTHGMARGAMGIDVGRFRGDDSLGIAIGNFANEMTALYVSKGNQMVFTDEALPSGLNSTRQDLTFGVFYFDPDLDGRLDIFAANGHLEEDIQKVQTSQHYEQPPQILWNCGTKHNVEFCPLTEESSGEDLLKPMVGRGAAFADIDGDGDQDFVITASGREPRLLRNDQELGHHWIRFKLQGTKTNRDAIGTWVTITLPDGRTLSQQVMPTRSYLSQVELPVTFGLGEATEIQKAEIRWPGGSVQVLEGLEVDRIYNITQESPAKL